jgi:hypothetical protein
MTYAAVEWYELEKVLWERFNGFPERNVGYSICRRVAPLDGDVGARNH